MGFTVTSALKWWVREHPDRVAIDYDGEAISYAEIYAWSSRVASQLAEWGVKPGDRITAFAVNSLEYAVLILAIMLTGGILAPVNFRSSIRELKRSLSNFTPALL